MNYETGILQNFTGQKLNLELTGYIVKGDNMIITKPNIGLQNAGEVDNRGIEFSCSANPSDNLAFNLTYSYTHMKTPVYATPRHNFFASVNYKYRKFKFMVSNQYINHLDSDPSANSESFETYSLLRSKISYQPFRFAEFFITSAFALL